MDWGGPYSTLDLVLVVCVCAFLTYFFVLAWREGR